MTFIRFVHDNAVGFACAMCGGVVVAEGQTNPPAGKVRQWREWMRDYGWHTSHALNIDLCPRCWKNAQN